MGPTKAGALILIVWPNGRPCFRAVIRVKIFDDEPVWTPVGSPPYCAFTA